MSTESRAQQEAREKEEHAAQALAHFQYLAPLLRALGLRDVLGRFLGYDMDAQIDFLSFTPQPPAGMPLGLRESIIQGMNFCVPPSWEIHPRQEGDLRLNVATLRCEFQLDDRFDGEWE